MSDTTVTWEATARELAQYVTLTRPLDWQMEALLYEHARRYADEHHMALIDVTIVPKLDGLGAPIPHEYVVVMQVFDVPAGYDPAPVEREVLAARQNPWLYERNLAFRRGDA